ncbi:MAG TPA: hypothetical protein VM099_01820 [Gemmatimonadaceae bacterium]|nr:hypothetical protein [Gemmatimonadaceae bacterium]
MSDNSHPAVGEVYVDFDGQQLVVASDEPKVLDYIRSKYVHMVVPRNSEPIGKLSVRTTRDGYVVNGTKELQHSDTIETLYDYLCHDIWQSFLQIRFDLLWLHAGAVEKNGCGVVIAGKSGNGKSTFVTQLLQRGWNVLSDEYAPIRLETNEVVPYPRRPRRRVFPGRELEEMEFGEFETEDIEIPADSVRRTPVVLANMVFPFFKVGATTQLEKLSPGDAVMEIIRNTTNFKHHRRLGIEWVVDFVKRVPCYRVTYADGADAAEAVNTELGGK